MSPGMCVKASIMKCCKLFALFKSDSHLSATVHNEKILAKYTNPVNRQELLHAKVNGPS